MKNKKTSSGIVYSTNPNYFPEEDLIDDSKPLSPNEQKLIIRLETKQRAGKSVTLVEGFIGNQKEKDDLVKKLKNFCGTGGSSKDDELLIQGDQRDKIIQWLQKNGYHQTKKK